MVCVCVLFLVLRRSFMWEDNDGVATRSRPIVIKKEDTSLMLHFIIVRWTPLFIHTYVEFFFPPPVMLWSTTTSTTVIFVYWPFPFSFAHCVYRMNINNRLRGYEGWIPPSVYRANCAKIRYQQARVQRSFKCLYINVFLNGFYKPVYTYSVIIIVIFVLSCAYSYEEYRRRTNELSERLNRIRKCIQGT